MPLRNDLLNPISPDHPAGESLRYAPVYDKIKEARREDDDAPQGDWKFERKQADWPQAIKLIGDSLATKTKDLQLAAWLAEAMLRREGIQSFREAIELIKGLIENFWDGLYPEIEDGDAEFRAAPLQWLGDKLDLAVKRAPITKGRLNSLQYEEAKKIGREEDVKDDYEKQAARSQAIQDGKIPMEVWDKDFDSTSKQFYVDLEASFDGTLETLDALGQLCDEKFGDVSPSFRGLKTALETTRQTVHILLQKKREKEPDEPVAATEEAPAEGAYETAGEAVAADGGAAAARAPVRRAGALAAEPVDRADAIARVVSAAKFLR
ncbi:MAG TPA: type VI secretion system protein TssA [Bryobacteraceae bacterium]|jgi:type VI secretion system protein ImpA